LNRGCFYEFRLVVIYPSPTKTLVQHFKCLKKNQKRGRFKQHFTCLKKPKNVAGLSNISHHMKVNFLTLRSADSLSFLPLHFSGRKEVDYLQKWLWKHGSKQKYIQQKSLFFSFLKKTNLKYNVTIIFKLQRECILYLRL
jgi:hypothetical protein